VGKPLAIIGDARLSGRADQHAVVERLLSISGEDAITIDRKHREPVTVQLPTRFMILTNELPKLADSSGALASRFVVLLLTQSWLGKEDVGLFDRLVPELPRILHWAIIGWQRMRGRRRFVPPDSAAQAIADLEDLASPVAAFLRDRCRIGDEFRVRADDLWVAWKSWTEDQGWKKPGIKQVFGKDLRAVVPRIRVTQPRNIMGKQERYYEGIGLQGGEPDTH